MTFSTCISIIMVLKMNKHKNIKRKTGDISILFACRVKLTLQAFRFMVGPGHCLMIPKYGPSLSKAVGQVDPSFLVVKKSHLNKNIHLTASLLTPQNRKYM